MDKNTTDKIQELDNISSTYSESVVILTSEYEIKGQVFIPKIGKKNRIVSDLLNGKKRFLAIKNYELTHRHAHYKDIENNDFLMLNVDSIVMLKLDA